MSAVAEGARALIGVRFRLHGRSEGLDCVGVAAAALRAAGWRGDAPTGYPLRGGDPGRVAALLDARFARATDARAGDLMLIATGPGQLHLGVRTDGGFVHADAGLGRVVERPGAPPWPILGAWRWEE